MRFSCNSISHKMGAKVRLLLISSTFQEEEAKMVKIVSVIFQF
jgi:hypothetical protein